MNFRRNTLLIIVVLIGLTSCLLTEHVSEVQVEIMKPGLFIYPENIQNVAVIKRDLYQSDTCRFDYLDPVQVKSDTTIKYSELSNRCVDAVASYLKESGYFKKVRNYRDSLNSEWNLNYGIYSPEMIFSKLKSDMLIFLDYFKFNYIFISNQMNDVYLAAGLSWTIIVKNDTAAYVYNQIDTLDYYDGELKSFNLEKDGHDKVIADASGYLGESFGKKIVPSWLQVNRMYYRSSNPDMLKAEQYALSNEWLKAAEIWNRETKNKNQKIVAKSCYNMALAAEMEGQIDVAIDWLVRSFSALPEANKEHQANCQRYINILAMRKKEIERLDKQIRN